MSDLSVIMIARWRTYLHNITKLREIYISWFYNYRTDSDIVHFERCWCPAMQSPIIRLPISQGARRVCKWVWVGTRSRRHFNNIMMMILNRRSIDRRIVVTRSPSTHSSFVWIRTRVGSVLLYSRNAIGIKHYILYNIILYNIIN